MPKPNKPHFHVWIQHRDGRMIYRLARPFHTRQAARQWARRWRPEAECMVFQCERPECAPKLR